MPSSVTVSINGKAYRLACDEGQEDHLLELAAQVNAQIDGLKGSFGEIGDGRLTVMAALTIADQLHEARRRLKQVETDLDVQRGLQARAAIAHANAEEGMVEALVTMAERVERITVGLGVRVQDEV